MLSADLRADGLSQVSTESRPWWHPKAQREDDTINNSLSLRSGAANPSLNS